MASRSSTEEFSECVVNERVSKTQRKHNCCTKQQSCLPHIGLILLFLLPLSGAGDTKDCSELLASNTCASYQVSDQRWIQSGPVSCMSNCEQWVITAHKGEVITLSFEYLDVPDRDPSNCLDSYILIGPENCQRLCGVYTNGVAISYHARTEQVKILYRRAGIFGLGFKLMYTIGHIPSEEPCTRSSEFRCRNGKCIPKSWQCNNASECEDDSDEICSDAEKAISTTVATPLDYSCGRGGFCCVDSIYQKRHCFADASRCNQIADCFDGRDEKDCGCQITHSDRYGIISYPIGPSYGLGCEFLVSVPNGTIQIRFTSFNFSNSDGGFLELYNGGVADELRLIGRYSWKKKPPKLIESDYNQVYIKYNRSSLSSYPSFNCTYQQKGICLQGQFSCVNEDDCYDLSSVCDGQWDCKRHGTDELNCGGCSDKSYKCRSGSVCYLYSSRCNGIPDCNNYADELQCLPEQCGHHNGTFLCQNGQCIVEHLVCNGYYNCKDNTDELNCPLPSKIVIAAVVGSLCCGLLLVIAAGSVCRLHAVRSLMGSRSHHISPITAIQEELLARLSAPPLYDEAMVTSRPYEEVRTEMLRRIQPEGPQNSEMNALPVVAEERRPLLSDINSSVPQASVRPQNDDDDDDVLIDVGGENNLAASASDSDLDCDAFNDSLVDLSLVTGLHAQWRRSHSSENPVFLSDADAGGEDLCLVDVCDSVPLICSNNEVVCDDDPKQIDSGRSNLCAHLKRSA